VPFNQKIYARVSFGLFTCYSVVELNLVAKNCTDLGVIKINAFLDEDSNGLFDNSDINYVNGVFTYEKNNDGIIHTIQSSTGYFTIISDDENDYYDIGFSMFSEYSSCYTLTISSFENESVTNGSSITRNFPVTKDQPCQDIGVYLIHSVPPRPGFDYENYLVIKNRSLEPIASGTITFTHDPLVTLNSVTEVDAGNSVTTTSTGFTLDFVNLLSGTEERVLISMNVPISLNIGDLLTNSASYSVSDLLVDNNNSVITETVVGSYDPNDIIESHGQYIVFNEFTSDDYLYYTIRFQNIGTAEAIDISIDNLLNSQLDKASVIMLNVSHDYVFMRVDDQLTWQFNNIYLPSDDVDEPNSHGYVNYKIKPLMGFSIGDIIPNKADIYFDFNPVVVTNTFETEFVATLSNKSFDKVKISIYPNPVGDKLFIDAKDIIKSIAVYNISGRLIQETSFIGVQNKIEITTKNMSQGAYFVKVITHSGVSYKKLIKR